jgi:hypothetical protein
MCFFTQPVLEKSNWIDFPVLATGAQKYVKEFTLLNCKSEKNT